MKTEHLPQLTAAIEASRDLDGLNHAQIAAALNTVDPAYTRVEPQIPIGVVLQYVAPSILGRIRAVSEDTTQTVEKRSLCLATEAIITNRDISVIDMRDSGAPAMLAGLVAYGVLTQAEADGFLALQTVPTSFARATWGEDAQPMEILRAFPGRW